MPASTLELSKISIQCICLLKIKHCLTFNEIFFVNSVQAGIQNLEITQENINKVHSLYEREQRKLIQATQKPTKIPYQFQYPLLRYHLHHFDQNKPNKPKKSKKEKKNKRRGVNHYRDISLDYASNPKPKPKKRVERLIRKQTKKFSSTRKVIIDKIIFSDPSLATNNEFKYKDRSIKNWEKRANQCEFGAISKEEFANELRRRMTSAEKVLWRELKSLGFKAQQVTLGFIPDFILPKDRIIIEVDGEIHNTPSQKLRDKRKDEIFINKHYKVLRFTNYQVFNNLQWVVEHIKRTILV